MKSRHLGALAIIAATLLLLVALFHPPVIEAEASTPYYQNQTQLRPPGEASINSALAFYAAEEAEGFVALFMKPTEMIAGIGDFIDMAMKNGTAVIPKIAEAMGLMYWQAANDTNPYDSGTNDHDTWQFFFLGTIVIVFVILAAYLVKNIKNLPQKIEDYKNTITKLKTKLSGFTSAEKGLDIAEDAADAAAAAAKAGSRTTGPGKFKALS